MGSQTMVKYSTAALAAAAFLAPQGAFAQWDNGGADNDWDNPLNWGGAVPAGANATVNLDGANRAIVSATPSFGIVDIFVGQGAGSVGEVDQLAGVHGTGAGNWGFIGDVGGTGTYNLADTTGAGGTHTGFATGSGDFSAGRLYVGIGAGSTGTLNVNTQGTLTSTNVGESFVIAAGGATGTTNLDAGTLTTPGEFQIGRSGNGTLNMSGGTINSGEWFVTGRDGGSVGELNMSGGTINASTSLATSFFVVGSFGGSTGTVNQSGGVIDASGGVGLFIGEGGMGTMNVSDTATVTGGALQIGLNDGGVGLFEVAGSTASVSVTDITLGLDSTLVDTTALGTLSFVADAGGVSTILASGDVNLGSDGDTLLVDLTGYTGAHVDMQLIDGATSSGAFTGLAQGTLAATDGNANPYYIDYTVAGDVWLTTTPIPEPASVALLGLGSLCLVRRRQA